MNFHGVWGDKAANLEKIKTHVREASKLGAKIISFPELAGSGYECGDEAQRENKRLRLGTVMGSKDLNKIFIFAAFREDDERYRSLPGNIPTLSRLVHPASNTANWNIRLPKDNQVYGSFQEIFS